MAIAVAFVTSLLVARDVGISHSDPTNRMRYHAIPVAISQIYHGRVHDYTANWSVAMKFHSERPLTEAIREAIEMPVPANDGIYYWTADDRGLSDFVNIGFRLFGPTIPSLFYFWFVLLGLSIATAVVRFRHDAMALTLIACTVIGTGATLPALARAALGSESPIHLSESRMFDMLGIVATIHLILVMIRPSAPSRWLEYSTVVAQAVLIAALVHARMSVAWLFAAILSAGILLICLHWSGSRLKSATTRPIVVVLCVVVTAWASLFIYQRLAFNNFYRSGIGPRTFWHNTLMGLSQNDVLARKLNIWGTDLAAVEAVLRDMRERNDPRLTKEWDAQNILNSLGSWNHFDWRTYEKVSRSLYLRTLWSDPWQTVRLFLWDKPTLVAELIGCQFLMLPCDQAQKWKPLPARSWLGPRHIGPLHWIWAGLLVLVAICLRRSHRNAPSPAVEGNVRGIALLLLFLALWGLAPSIVIYSGALQLGGTVILLLTALGFSIVFGIERLQRSWSAARA